MSSRLRASVEDVVRGAQSAREAEDRIRAHVPDVSRVLVEKRHDHFEVHLKVGGGRGVDVYVS